MKHLALAVTDQERSRRFYETYFGFDAQPPRRYDDDVLMLYNADGFSLALGPVEGPVALPPFLHFGIGLESPEAVRGVSRPAGARRRPDRGGVGRAGVRQRQVSRPGRLYRRGLLGA